MVLKGFSAKEWRRALADPEEEEEILQTLSNLKINEEEEDCGWHIFTEEIFPRFPPNQLQTLKSVCKNWNRIISSPYFVSLHLNVYNQSRIRVLMPERYGIIEYKISSCDSQETNIIHYQPEISQISRSALILGSCDGLICFYWKGIGRTIAMYNPSTGKYFWVKSRLKDYYSIKCSWFGRHPCSGEYVLVLGNYNDEVGVYKFNRRSNLNKIHSTFYRQGIYSWFEQRVGTLLHGATHWPAQRYCPRNDDCHVICAYHLDNNKYFEISPPLQRDFELGVADGCLFAFFRAAAGVFELWIMKEYKVQQSWTKYASIEGFKARALSPLAFFPNGNLTLYPNPPKESGLIKYTFNDNKSLLLINHDYGTSEAIMCVDSLVSPKIVGT